MRREREERERERERTEGGREKERVQARITCRGSDIDKGIFVADTADDAL